MDSPTKVGDRSADPAARPQLLRAVVASTVGTSIEWYDFFLYGSAAALVFPKLFFPAHNQAAAVLASFATQAVGFAARPVGAAIFGHLGDRIGRKATLIATLLIMGLATAAIAVVPGYATIGIWGAVLLVALRVLQGIGVGGEWGGSILLSMEWGSQRRRGLVASWPQVGVPIGLILGNGALLLFNAISGSAFLSWGWRVPFLLSLVLLAIGLYIRLGVTETPLFRQLLQERRIESQPLVTALEKGWREIILSSLARVSEQAPFYVFTVFVLAYGANTLHQSSRLMLASVLGAAGLSLLTIPLAGHFSDRIGRKRMYLSGVVLVGLFAFPYFGLLNSAVPALIILGVVLSLIPHDLQYGPQASLIAESFTGRYRYSGASLGYQLASVVAGGPAPLLAVFLLSTFHSSVPISLYLVLCALISLVAVLLLPDRSRVDHMREYEEAPLVAPAMPAQT
ncbi:MAG TPA: MFS transporter [Candidatus Dormibacteraeota bacterium]|nr:MFS transporter [Candidatus Dormibacteraeota bacterium]